MKRHTSKAATHSWSFILATGLVLALGVSSSAQTAKTAKGAAKPVPTPASVIGWEPGADYKMVDSKQVHDYFQKLAAASDRIKLVEIGRSVGGTPLPMAIISSEDNLRQLEKYRDISRKLALARGVTDQEARRLSLEGKAVIWIDHGLHATEPAHVEAGLLLAHRLLTSDEPDVKRIRQNAIVLMPPLLNPDGRDRLLGWYQKVLGTPYETTSLPFLDHPYVGHENNRDGFQISTPEVVAMTKVMWQDWIPQIVVNHHQGSPFPARIFIPPYQEPVNPDIPALVLRGITTVGAIMGQRFDEEGKTGVVSRASYTLWGNGPVRAAGTFHNQIGILVEVQSRPAMWATPGFTPPDSIRRAFGIPTAPVGMTATEPSMFYPSPWKGGKWTFRDQVDYFVTASMGAADAAARLSDQWLYNIYRMGKEALEQGKQGKPYAYVIPSEQWDASEAIELVNSLRRGAVEVRRATAPFTAGGRQYPANTFVAFASQPFRAALVDVMEAQHHPDLRRYPGGPPIPPYDGAGWTMPMGMGVEADRIDEPFEAATVLETEPATRTGVVKGQGAVYLLSTTENASFRALNQLWTAGAEVSRAKEAFTSSGGEKWVAGTFVVRAPEPALQQVAKATGVSFVGASAPPVATIKIGRPRVGLYQSYMVRGYHNPDEGWTRWILERYGIQYETIKDADIRAGDLSRFGVIVLPDQENVEDDLRGHAEGTMPPEYVGGLGSEGSAALKRYAEAGGTVVAMDQSSHFVIEQFGLPIQNAVAQVSNDLLFIPGSFLRAEVDATHPIAYGLPAEVATMYYRRRAGDEHMAFEIVRPASAGDKRAPRNVEVVARFAKTKLLMSGWEIGADTYLGGTPAVVQVPVGKGSAVLINFRAQFRDQVHGTFKFLFNAMIGSAAQKPSETTAQQ